jgi:hypothetical protein
VRGRATAVGVALLAFAGGAGAQQVTADPLLTMQEVTRSGATHAMDARTRAVDVNSRIRIALDRDALRQTAGGAALPTDVTDDAVAVTGVLRGANEAVAAMRSAEAAFSASPNPQTRAALLAALQPLGQRVLTVIAAAPPGTPLRAQLNAALRQAGPSPAAQYAAVFAAAAAHVDSLQSQVEAFAAQQGMRVRMGAWLVTDQGSREVHLPGFDTVQTQAPNVLPTFQIFLSEQQVAQLRALADQARTLRAQADASPFADVATLRDRLQVIASQGLTCAEALPGQLAPLQAGARQPFQAANDSLLGTWRTLKARYGTGAALTPDLLVAGPRDAAAAWEVARAWFGAASALVARAPATGDAAVTAARTALESCRNELQTRLAADLGPLAAGFASQSARRLATESLEFSDRVLSLDISKVPTDTELSLVTAGPRSPGDQLALRVSAVDASGRERVLASRSYAVERAEPYIHLTVAMVWARRDPPKDAAGTPRGNEWHPAPGYSILAKRFLGGGRLTRRFPLYGEVLSPGIGLNLSAPDFNLDDTPEFAAGIVLSLFRDYLQAGYSYNFQQTRWFPFIGIRLPLPSATLPVTESTSPES